MDVGRRGGRENGEEICGRRDAAARTKPRRSFRRDCGTDRPLIHQCARLAPRTFPLAPQADAVVHAVGLLFDVDSGLTFASKIVSGSDSVPGDDSTYDRVTRQTAFAAIDATAGRVRLPFSPRTPFAFVSCAESGWPDVSGGAFVESNLAPEWLRRYLAAKRAVEAKLSQTSDVLRPVIFRPSLIWSWDKLDVLPIIPARGPRGLARVAAPPRASAARGMTGPRPR